MSTPARTDISEQAETAEATAPYSLGQMLAYFLKLGSLGFGGPVALVGYMHRDLVESRRWISEADFREGMALAQLAPGPLAAQLAIYLGYVRYRILGATLVGLAFVLPSFVMVVALGWAYQHYGGLSWMQAVFYGVGSAVIGIIAHSATQLTRRTIGRDRLLWLIYLVSAASIVVTETEYIALFLAAGVLVWLVRTRRTVPGGAAVGMLAPLSEFVRLELGAEAQRYLEIVLFFGKAGAFVFGSGLAIVPFLYGGVVHEHGWLNEQQFLDAVAVAMITPGPVVITVGFIGYLIDDLGLTGATLAAAATFLPCYLFTILPAPYFKKYGRRAGIAAFVEGVTAAAVGAIAGSVLVLSRRAILDDAWRPEWPKVVILVAVLAVMIRRKVPEPLIVLAAAIVGLVIYPYVR